MSSDPIEQLLREADEQRRHAPDADPAELAERVLRCDRSRRVRRTAASIAVLVIAVMGTAIFVNRSMSAKPDVYVRVSEPAPKDPDVNVRLGDELAEIQSEIAQREAIVARLVAGEQMRSLNARLGSVQQLPTAEDAAKRAAAAMVVQTDRMLRSVDLPQPAIDAYLQVINCFPHTVSAEQARQRVAGLSNRKEG